tara:strand:+ start:458 stop:1015 length:558 start_codon:yes stop_codon:yes gene_type:complete
LKTSSFLKEFLNKNNQVGAIAPSSKYLTKKMMGNLALSEANVVIELGPGTGVFTKKLLELIGPKTKLLVIEINTSFYNTLKQQLNDPRLTLINGSATDISLYLKQQKLAEADVIISSLPLAVLPSFLRNRIVLSASDALSKKGKYVQFQYTLQSQKMLEKVFSTVKIKSCLLNIPPAFVYTCTKE